MPAGFYLKAFKVFPERFRRHDGVLQIGFRQNDQELIPSVSAGYVVLSDGGFYGFAGRRIEHPGLVAG